MNAGRLVIVTVWRGVLDSIPPSALSQWMKDFCLRVCTDRKPRANNRHFRSLVGVDRILEAGHAPTDAKKGRSQMAPSFFTTSSFYDFFNMLSMAGISFAVKAFIVVVFTFPCELSANENAVCISSLGHSPIVT